MKDQNKTRTVKFKTEVSQLLDLMIHSLYSNRDVFIRELISNSSDALDKLRFSSLSDEQMLEQDGDYKIIIRVDKKEGRIIIEDNGIGMTEKEVIDNIGTIANSGTKKFLEKLDKGGAKGSHMIGQFGVGFYSVFMVSDTVSIETRKAGTKPEEGVLWVSAGGGDFTLQSVKKVKKGTTITLNIRQDAPEYLDDWKIREIVSQYSEHIPFSVMMPKVQAEKEGENKDEVLETVNSAQALWLKSSKEVKEDEYQSFYKSTFHDYQDALCWIHNRVEGSLEYTSLLYIPNKAPFDLFDREQKRGIKLYVKRVFIMDDAENLLPNWLRFVRGVVDCADLPLNVSREILQDNQTVRKIKSALVKRVIAKFEDLAKNQEEQFLSVWREFGTVIKEGIVEENDNQEKVASLLRFSTTESEDKLVSLKQYLGRMKENQNSIFYLCADSYQSAKSSPHLEIFKEKGVEVLLLSDRIDEWVTSHLNEFEGKQLHSANRVEDKQMEELESVESIEKPESAEEVVDCVALIKRLKESLGDKVSEVKESKRLRHSPACIVSDPKQMTHNMQKIMQAMGQEVQKIKPVLEINPTHPLIIQLNEKPIDDFSDWALLLLDQALLSEGAQLDSPGDFVMRLNRLLTGVMDKKTRLVLPT